MTNFINTGQSCLKKKIIDCLLFNINMLIKKNLKISEKKKIKLDNNNQIGHAIKSGLWHRDTVT